MKLSMIVCILFSVFLGFGQEFDLNTKDAKVHFEFVSEELQGTVGGVEAKIKLNLLDLGSSTISGTADVSTLSTGNNMRDKHLKSDDFFDAEKYPKMIFESTSLTKVGEKYIANGSLTIAGVTKEVKFEILVKENELIFSTLINADDFGVSPKNKEKSTVKVSVNVPL